MTDKHILSVETRTVVGKKVKKLREREIMVASISTPQGKAISIQLDEKKFTKMMQSAGESALLYLEVEGEKSQRPVLIEEIQVHPISEAFLHVSFRQVSLKEKVISEIPVEIVGETDVPDTTLVVVRDMVEVEALPTDLPDKFEIDVSVLTKAGQTISLANLKYDSSKVTLVLGEDQTPENMPIAMLQEIKEEVEEPEESGEGQEGAEGEAAAGETDESTTPAEGEKPEEAGQKSE